MFAHTHAHAHGCDANRCISRNCGRSHRDPLIHWFTQSCFRNWSICRRSFLRNFQNSLFRFVHLGQPIGEFVVYSFVRFIISLVPLTAFEMTQKREIRSFECLFITYSVLHSHANLFLAMKESSLSSHECASAGNWIKENENKQTVTQRRAVAFATVRHN